MDRKQQSAYEIYLSSLPADRRPIVDQVWSLVRKKIPVGYTETIGPRFLTFTAEGEWYVALANMRNYLSLYLMPASVFPELKAKLDSSGKKLKRGKSCINFRKADDLPLEIIGEIVASKTARKYVETVRRLREDSKAAYKASKAR